MNFPVKKTKLVLPRRRSELLSRHRLIELLEQMLQKRLIYVSAPAGYGKTSLLVDFAHSADVHVCWLSLDSLDRDPRRFVAHFTAALESRFPDFGRQTLAYIENVPPGQMLEAEILSTHLVNEILECTDHDLLLILDDFHHVDESDEIVAFINQFVLDLPENFHLIIASRTLPSLPDLPLMVARMQVGGLSYEELAFRPGEIQELCSQIYDIQLSTRDAHALADATEGWITGLMLTFGTRWQDARSQLRIARLSGIGLFDYLAQQILQAQPGEIRTFLMYSSLFDEFNAAYCHDILEGEYDWRELIQQVWRKNLFIYIVDKEETWYRYHPLFREFLQDTLLKEAPTDFRRIMGRLVERYVASEDWDKAHELTRRLSEPNRLADLIDQATESLTASGRYHTLESWISELPSSILESRPRLVALDGILKVVLKDPAAGVDRLTAAIETFRQQEDRLNLADSLIKRTFGRRYLGDYQASLEDAEDALALGEQALSLADNHAERWKRLVADALRAMGTNQLYLGRSAEAAESIVRSLENYQSVGDQKSQALTRNDLGFVLNGAGRYRAAIAEYEQALEYWTVQKNLIQQATVLNNLAVAKHALGSYKEAVEDFHAAIDRSQKAGFRRLESLAHAGLADLYTDLGLHEVAQVTYGTSRRLAVKQGFIFLLLYLDLMESRLSRRISDRKTARRLLNRSAERAEASENNYERGLYALHAGEFAYEDGDYASAIDWLGRALRHFSENGHRVEAGRANLLLAGSYLLTDRRSEAVEALKSGYVEIGTPEHQGIIFSVGQLIRRWLVDLEADPEVGSIARSILGITDKISIELLDIRRSLKPPMEVHERQKSGLHIRALGHPQVSVDGRTLTAKDWQTQVAQDMFFCLLAHPAGLGRDALGEIFWPEKPVDKLRKNVKNTLYRLRKAAGKSAVVYENERYRFRHNPQHFYDVEAFTEALRTARYNTFPDERLPYYQRAAELYRGDYLPDADYSWAHQERENLRRRYLVGEMEYGELLIDQKEYVAALESSYRVLVLEPCEESAHRCAMLANHGLGNQAGIVRQFRRCEQDLRRILDTGPSAETRNLYNRLIA